MNDTHDVASTVHPGLWLVATPIGNLDDLSPRAAAVLRAADVVCCEDTRHSGSLLKRIGAAPQKLIVVNEHTEFDAIDEIASLVSSGGTVALVTDAGTPGVSDPGERVVAALAERGLPVWAVPGPVAFVVAATISGLPAGRIAFDGFLPRGGSERRERLTEVARERRTTVLYEAPHRLVATVRDLHDACGGDRRIAIVRELTKMHEQVWRGTLAEALGHVESVEPRGEHAIVVEPNTVSQVEISDEEIVAALTQRTGAGLSTRDAVDEVTLAFGVPRKRVYNLAVAG